MHYIQSTTAGAIRIGGCHTASRGTGSSLGVLTVGSTGEAPAAQRLFCRQHLVGNLHQLVQEDALNLLNGLGITYPTGFTTDGTVIKEFGVFSMPTTLFISSDGEVFRKWSGALNLDKLVEITNEMLAAE